MWWESWNHGIQFKHEFGSGSPPSCSGSALDPQCRVESNYVVEKTAPSQCPWSPPGWRSIPRDFALTPWATERRQDAACHLFHCNFCSNLNLIDMSRVLGSDDETASLQGWSCWKQNHSEVVDPVALNAAIAKPWPLAICPVVLT